MFSLLRAYRHIHNLLASVCSGLDHFVVQFGTCWAATGLVLGGNWFGALLRISSEAVQYKAHFLQTTSNLWS